MAAVLAIQPQRCARMLSVLLPASNNLKDLMHRLARFLRSLFFSGVAHSDQNHRHLILRKPKCLVQRHSIKAHPRTRTQLLVLPASIKVIAASDAERSASSRCIGHLPHVPGWARPPRHRRCAGQSKTRGPIGGAMTSKPPYGLAISSPPEAGNGAMVQKLEK